MFNQIFQRHFLFNEMHQGKKKTFVASCQRVPDIEKPEAFTYVREIDDFISVHYSQIIAVLKPKPQP